jgi:hypothetical protein
MQDSNLRPAPGDASTLQFCLRLPSVDARPPRRWTLRRHWKNMELLCRRIGYNP